MKKYDINHSIIIYPNERGWRRLRDAIMKDFRFKDESEVESWLKSYTTEDGGFKDQMWSIMSKLPEFFKEDTNYLKTCSITLCNEPE